MRRAAAVAALVFALASPGCRAWRTRSAPDRPHFCTCGARHVPDEPAPVLFCPEHLTDPIALGEQE